MIRGARRRARLSQSALASRIATSQPTLSAYERGHKVPSAATLDRILAAAGHRLTSSGGRQVVITPTAAAHQRVARNLAEVLELAAALPSRPALDLRYPRLPAGEPVRP